GRSEEEDVTQQHAAPPRAVEGNRTCPGDLRQSCLPREAPAAHRVPILRSVRPPRGPSTGARLL
ncbi:MAG: LSU ribosomal protein L32p @ LSU ribosomal protein L32p, zinc-dependent, partial [uncultured Propionibacteriaceae bacterium]